MNNERRNIKTQSEYIEFIETDNANKNNEINELRMLLNEAYKEIDDSKNLEEHLKSCKIEIDSLQSGLNKLDNEREKLRKDNNDKSNLIQELKFECDMLKSDLETKEEISLMYQDDNNRLNEKLKNIINKSKREVRLKLYKYTIMAYGAVFIVSLIYLLWRFILTNPSIFKITDETISFVTNFYNIFILFFIPMFFGALSAFARLCFSDISLIKGKGIKLIFASGLMAAFSWVGVKSKLFVALLIPYLEAKPSIGEAIKNIDITEFYSMVLVSIIVGMFASNLFVFIDNKAKMLRLESKVNANSTTEIDKNNMKSSESFPN